MPIPTPQLESLTFQQLVDHAKRLIPRYCPEWTDHNVSDPGVTLIELFASMVEMLAYRVNQVPDRMYIAFLNYIGAQLEPAQPARAELTFYLSKAVTEPPGVTIPANTRVTTVRTETDEPIAFTTRADLVIRPLSIAGAYRVPAGADRARRPDAENSAWSPLDLARLNTTGGPAPVFADVEPSQSGGTWPAPGVGDALYLALDPATDPSDHVLVLVCGCVNAGGGGSSPASPPVEWQLWDERAAEWLACQLDSDGTGGFNRDGRVTLRLPRASPGAKGGRGAAYWLRCRLTQAQQPGRRFRYEAMPRLTSLRLASSGGTITAWQEERVDGEVLGESDGTPGQVFRLRHAPLLARAPGERLTVRASPDAEPEPWDERPHFGGSTRESPDYTLDSFDGTLSLGPLLRQPDGSVVQLGKVPPRGSLLAFSSYRYGGGAAGNVGPHELTVIKASLSGVRQVTNHSAASGGVDGQTVNDLRLVPPAVLGLRTRAVTADDFAALAAAVPGIARSRCLAPGRRPAAAPGEPAPGEVVVLAAPAPGQLPALEPIAADALELPAGDPRLRAVWRDLDARAVLGCAFAVRAPSYLWVRVSATVTAAPGADKDRLKQEVLARLYRYLNPFTGGPDGAGWPFDRAVYFWELQNQIRAVPGVLDARVQLCQTRRDRRTITPEPDPVLSLEPRRDELICSDEHLVSVQ